MSARFTETTQSSFTSEKCSHDLKAPAAPTLSSGLMRPSKVSYQPPLYRPFSLMRASGLGRRVR
jgi:hypothetical protein